MPLPDDMPVGSGNGGAPPSHIPDGSYIVTLQDVRPRTRQRGDWANPCKEHTKETRPANPRCNACQYPDDIREVFEFWFKEESSGDTFTFESGQSTHEKSKLVTTVSPALKGEILAGSEIRARAINVMIGRKCFGQIKANPKGYAKLVNLMPLPAGVSVGATQAPPGVELDSYGNPVTGYDDPDDDQ